MDDNNGEGLVGTEGGQVFYVNFDAAEKLEVFMPVKVISSCNNNQGAVDIIKFD
jgi:hypothetical protein